MNIKSRAAIFAVTLLTCLATSCMCKGEVLMINTPYPSNTPVPTVIEPGLAYGIPCKPPCWQGLIPGESTSQEVERVMEQLRDSECVYHIQDNRPWQYDVYPLPSTAEGVIHVIMDVDTGTVTRINGQTLFYYSAGTLVEQFGDPEGLYLVSKGATVCLSCEDWEPGEPMQNVPVHLLYPSQGLYFLALVPHNGLGCICPEMRVTSFCYYASTTMKEAFADNLLSSLCSSVLDDVVQNDLVEWHGFGGGY